MTIDWQTKVMTGLTLYCAGFIHSAYAGYEVLGPVRASHCVGFVVKICSLVTVKEVRKGGVRYEITNKFSSVTKYDSSSGQCLVMTDRFNLGLISKGLDVVLGVEFWGVDKDGVYKQINTEYLSFKCAPVR